MDSQPRGILYTSLEIIGALGFIACYIFLVCLVYVPVIAFALKLLHWSWNLIF